MPPLPSCHSGVGWPASDLLLWSDSWQAPGQQLPHGAWTNGSTEQRARQFTRNLSNQATGSKPENRQGNPAEHELSELQDL